MYCGFICIMLLASWEFAATSPLATFGAHHKQDKGQNLQSSRHALDTNQEYEVKGLKAMDADHHKQEERLIGPGSRPPKCEHKCRGCQPCIAVQVPETTEHLVVEYANYEPEGWVCKCGSSFFIP